jgi:hypothetical protein
MAEASSLAPPTLPLLFFLLLDIVAGGGGGGGGGGGVPGGNRVVDEGSGVLISSTIISFSTSSIVGRLSTLCRRCLGRGVTAGGAADASSESVAFSSSGLHVLLLDGLAARVSAEGCSSSTTAGIFGSFSALRLGLLAPRGVGTSYLSASDSVALSSSGLHVLLLAGLAARVSAAGCVLPSSSTTASIFFWGFSTLRLRLLAS